MAVLLVTSSAFADHDSGPGHPERATRLDAVAVAVGHGELRDALVPLAPRGATRAEIERVHRPGLIDQLEALDRAGGGAIDADTATGPRSFHAALLSAGSGLVAVEHLENVGGDAAFCAVRPPGHHATPIRSMGFCLLNNVAITAASLAERGERVAIVDFDAHHGNGTQDAFYGDGRVLYVSFHEWPLYPGTGALEETGTGEGAGTTLNIPLPRGATGDVFRLALDEVVLEVMERFAPDWLLLSAGFDAHRLDPLTGLSLAAGDFGDLVAVLAEQVKPGRVIAFLEGGYDLDALAASTTATLAALAGLDLRPESATSGGPGRAVVDAARRLHLDR